jgi:hypothetical protein
MKLPTVAVIVPEGRFVFLGSSRPYWQTPKQGELPGRFIFQRLLRNGEYATKPDKPPGRLTWRRKARAAAAKSQSIHPGKRRAA